MSPFFFLKNKTSRHGKDLKKLEPSCNAGKHVEQCVRRGKMSGSLSASRTEGHLGRHTRGNMFYNKRIYTNIYTMVTHSNPKVKTTQSDERIHRMNINTVSKILIIKRNGAWMRQSTSPVVPGTTGTEAVASWSPSGGHSEITSLE